MNMKFPDLPSKDMEQPEFALILEPAGKVNKLDTFIANELPCVYDDKTVEATGTIDTVIEFAKHLISKNSEQFSKEIIIFRKKEPIVTIHFID